MSLSPTLRYYRQQFNPEAAYSQQGRDSGIMSMYDPEGMGRFVEAVAKRQERFDTAKMAEASEIARIGETETYDLAELTNRIKSFESGVNSLVKDKYNGDYSAAANEIAKMIGTERSNPFYHFNKQKVEMGKAFLDAKMKLGSNFMSAGSPFDVSFQDWQNGATFDFTPVNRADIVKDAATEFSSLAETIRNNPKLQSTAGGQYFLSTIQHGIADPEQLREFLSTEDGQLMVQNIVDRNPNLAALPREQVMGAVFEGAHSAIGRAQTQYLTNQAYGPMLDAQLEGAPSGKLIIGGSKELGVEKGDIYSSALMTEPRNRIAKEVGRKSGFNINTFEELSALKGKDASRARKEAKELLLQEYTDQYKNAAIPVIDINSMWGNTGSSHAEVTANLKGVNEYIQRNMEAGDVVGIDKENSKLLDGMTNIEFKGLSIIPSGFPDNPFIYQVDIKGVPESRGAKKAQPVPVRTIIHPDNSRDAFNIFNEFQSLDKGLLQTLYGEYVRTKNQPMLDAIDQMAKISGTTIVK